MEKFLRWSFHFSLILTAWALLNHPVDARTRKGSYAADSPYSGESAGGATEKNEDTERWQESGSRHFSVYYRDVPRDFVKNVEEAAERYYEEITRDLGFSRDRSWSLDERARIYIYRDRDDYLRFANQAGWSHGAANPREKIIRTFPSAHGFFDSTLPHELGHIIFREFIGTHASIPAWLDEGVAMYQEKAKRWGVNKLVKQALEKNTFIPLDSLSQVRLDNRASPEVVNLFYAESASVVYYLITELGERRFVRFCDYLKEEQAFPEALRRAYGRFDTVEDLNQSWVEYVRKHN